MFNSLVEIRKKIIEIVKKIFSLTVSADTLLLGNETNLVARDLLVLYIEVEKSFNLSFEESDIEKYGFKTVADISMIIYNKLH